MIKGIRLVTGEDIIGDVDYEDTGIKVIGWAPTKLTINKPAIVGVQRSSDGQPQMGLGDFLPFSKVKKIEIVSDKIVYFYEPMLELVNAYNINFGTGLVRTNTGLPFLPK